MADMERNADVVYMTAYAPLFANVEGWQWRPDLIWYDNLRMFKSCSYYVQQMYAVNKGTNVLRMTMDKKPIAGQPGQDGLFASSVFDKTTGEVIIKIINTSKQPQPVSVKLLGMKGTRTAETITLTHNGMDDENTLDNPELITPKNGTLSVDAGKDATLLTDNIPAMSFRLYKVKK
jgi:alpha-L-arabinofuranosidase